ncbi:hypothetical protein [Halorhabdus amylolytica]|uniref:hypothetical protein n=1 Tax=Halorhabdus amylolytica TaxID=2559573 RepID=UPI0010AABA21|nr:hypothetical protein [Halorhabdus amylolytica]
MDGQTEHSQLIQFGKEISETTNKWWYFPTLCGFSNIVILLMVYFPIAPGWISETFTVLVVLPSTLLAIPAIIFDILNKYKGGLPPGLFIYPPALLIGLFTNNIIIVLSILLYAIIWL